jgi:hypothetical protein
LKIVDARAAKMEKSAPVKSARAVMPRAVTI